MEHIFWRKPTPKFRSPAILELPCVRKPNIATWRAMQRDSNIQLVPSRFTYLSWSMDMRVHIHQLSLQMTPTLRPSNCSCMRAPNWEPAGWAPSVYWTIRENNTCCFKPPSFEVVSYAAVIADNCEMQPPKLASWLPWWLSGKEPTCQCRRQGFNPWSGTIPQAAEQLSPCATTIEPVRHNYWSPCALEPVRHSKGNHGGKPVHGN